MELANSQLVAFRVNAKASGRGAQMQSPAGQQTPSRQVTKLFTIILLQ